MRHATYIYPGEFEIHKSTDSLGLLPDTVDCHDGGIHYKSVTYQERTYFEHISTKLDSEKRALGVWNVEVPPGSTKWYSAAHHLIDYVKIYDVPKNVQIPNFPQ